MVDCVIRVLVDPEAISKACTVHTATDVQKAPETDAFGIFSNVFRPSVSSRAWNRVQQLMDKCAVQYVFSRSFAL